MDNIILKMPLSYRNGNGQHNLKDASRVGSGFVNGAAGSSYFCQDLSQLQNRSRSCHTEVTHGTVSKFSPVLCLFKFLLSLPELGQVESSNFFCFLNLLLVSFYLLLHQQDESPFHPFDFPRNAWLWTHCLCDLAQLSTHLQGEQHPPLHAWTSLQHSLLPGAWHQFLLGKCAKHPQVHVLQPFLCCLLSAFH